MRLDKYLKVSRLIKRRTIANEACDAGRVLVNDMDWAAKSIDDSVYKKGEKVIVEKIEGVKCLVRKA